MIIDNDEYLQHFGVKGMKWGVRRNRDPKTGRVEKKPPSDDSERATGVSKQARSSGVSSLSNSELKTFIERANLEKQFKTLEIEQHSSNAGAKYARDLLIGVGKEQLRNALSKKTAKAVAKAFGA